VQHGEQAADGEGRQRRSARCRLSASRASRAGQYVPFSLLVQLGDVCLFQLVAAVWVHRGFLKRVGEGVQQGPPGSGPLRAVSAASSAFIQIVSIHGLCLREMRSSLLRAVR
jgi:hypothetical protein